LRAFFVLLLALPGEMLMDEQRLRQQMDILERTIGGAFVRNDLPVHR
jgi:hypothetical protein